MRRGLCPATVPQPLEDGQYTYFILDYRPTRKLDHYCQSLSGKQKSAFTLEKAYILLEILRGLELLGCAGAVHRYISPNNIYIDFQGGIWISGFNLAKFDNADEHWVEESLKLSFGVRVGNPYYMAPELFGTQGLKAAEHRSDLWSFAAIAYKIMSTHLLFPQGLREIRAARYQPLRCHPLRTLVPNIPRRYCQFIETCLKEKVTHRYANAGALLGEMIPEINRL